ncbi:neuralized-like protein 4 [Glandiceps talaboti]
MGCGASIQRKQEITEPLLIASKKLEDDSDDESNFAISPPSGSSLYHFHSRCGKHVAVLFDGRTARRKRATKYPDYGVVVTRQPLKNHQRFEILLDSVTEEWAGTLKIGITSIPPDDFTFPSMVADVVDHFTFIWTGSSGLVNGNRKVIMRFNLDNCKTGDRIGLEKRESGALGFFVNDQEVCKRLRLNLGSQNPGTVYGVVDVYGRTDRVTVCDPQVYVKMTCSPIAKEADKTSDSTSILNEIKTTIATLKKRDIDLNQAANLVNETLLKPYAMYFNSARFQRQLGDQIAQLGGAPELQYLLNKLSKTGLGTGENEASKRIILETCWNYSECSVKLCKFFGECGLLSDLLHDLETSGPSYQTEEELHPVLSTLSILHNCAKAAENKQVYMNLETSAKLKPFLHCENTDLAMLALFTISHIYSDDNVDVLGTNTTVISHIINVFAGAMDCKNLIYNRYTAKEVVVGLGRIARNEGNAVKILDNGRSIPLLVQLVGLNLPMEGECAINVLWELGKHRKLRSRVAEEPTVFPCLRSAMKNDIISIRQAAERALMILKPPLKPPDPPSPGTVASQEINGNKPCDYKDLCLRFKEDLDIPDVFFDNDFDMCYCTKCHTSRGDSLYYTRGQPARDYAVPIGWYRIALKVPPGAQAHDVFNNWHVAFHGTRRDAIRSILDNGQLLMPGDETMGGEVLGERPGHYTDNDKPEGFDTKHIFLSPSIRYAGCNVYAYPVGLLVSIIYPPRFTDTVTNQSYQARVVFQVRIKPDSYSVGPETIGAASEIDPNFSNQEIEWFTKQRGSVIMSGLLVKVD